MSSNPHFEEASALLADKPGQYEIEKSKALATLALAYEQRTANYIAKMSLNLQMIQTAGLTLTTTDADWDAMDDTVLARLGLDK